MNSSFRAHGVTPRKSLGQNFLVDEATARRIVAAAEVTRGDLALEIGPGTGALTVHLAAQAGRVVAIELDRALIPTLKQALGAASNVTVVQGDALAVDLAALAQAETEAFGRPFDAVRVVANLPYYITSAAIRRILESGLPMASIVLTVQREVAERIVARPPDMSLLAVSVQFYGRPELLFRIPPDRFYPQPEVDSAVMRITPHAQPYAVDREQFFRLVKAGFSQPRKQLRNTLSAGLRMNKAQVERSLLANGVDPCRRAESLEMDEWVSLTQFFISGP